ncbi:hypothetical protein AS189_17700 [Arthrobacter alpinus]|uniref:Uncharacterized protein n=1 Tax=Arthrobacter alpinus TaxID=656366 RepID=A0A0S2M392_9MICC|nr:hypothetical protein [Arthrobacter alpinus]ALO67984.1 hypothetical protein AS189_17700 [Arthrobacter alpinus]
MSEITPTMAAPDAQTEPLLGTRTWLTLIIVGFAGQLAWTVENMYLNVFVYNTISTNPAVLALLVSSSAVVATLATFLVGAASDRARRRRVFIAVFTIIPVLRLRRSAVDVDTFSSDSEAAAAVADA